MGGTTIPKHEGAGTAKGPYAIMKASTQIDLYDTKIPDIWKMGIALDESDVVWEAENFRLRGLAKNYLVKYEQGVRSNMDYGMIDVLHEVNSGCAWLKKSVAERAKGWIEKGKTVALLGGAHSVALGLIYALADQQ